MKMLCFLCLNLLAAYVPATLVISANDPQHDVQLRTIPFAPVAGVWVCSLCLEFALPPLFVALFLVGLLLFAISLLSVKCYASRVSWFVIPPGIALFSIAQALVAVWFAGVLDAVAHS